MESSGLATGGDGPPGRQLKGGGKNECDNGSRVTTLEGGKIAPIKGLFTMRFDCNSATDSTASIKAGVVT